MSTNIGIIHGNNHVEYISTDQMNYGGGCEDELRMMENTVDIVQNKNEYVVHNTQCATDSPYQFSFNGPMITVETNVFTMVCGNMECYILK